MGGLSIAFVIVLQVLVWAVVFYITFSLSSWSSRGACWVAFVFLLVYAVCLYAYCLFIYDMPGQRIVTNFLFGAVPLAVSSAFYILALIALDALKLVTVDEEKQPNILDRLNPWKESFCGRLIFFLAVIPGLISSIYLGCTVSVGFDGQGTHFDILSFCLFVDVFRFTGHLSYLFAPTWSIGESPDSISSRPGLCYIFWVLCMVWYVFLARLVAGHEAEPLLADRTKIYTLASLASYVFFPLSIHFNIMNLQEMFEQTDLYNKWQHIVPLVLSMIVLSFFMLLVAAFFDIIEPNLMGIGLLLWCIFYTSAKAAWSPGENSKDRDEGVLLRFIMVLLSMTLVAYGVVFLSTHYTTFILVWLRHALAP